MNYPSINRDVLSERDPLSGLAVGPHGGTVLRVSDGLVPDDLWERLAPLLLSQMIKLTCWPGRNPDCFACAHSEESCATPTEQPPS